jgi:hypothetical protein
MHFYIQKQIKKLLGAINFDFSTGFRDTQKLIDMENLFLNRIDLILDFRLIGI